MLNNKNARRNRSVDNRFQMQLHEGGSGITGQSGIEWNGRWPTFHRERQGISQIESNAVIGMGFVVISGLNTDGPVAAWSETTGGPSTRRSPTASGHRDDENVHRRYTWHALSRAHRCPAHCVDGDVRFSDWLRGCIYEFPRMTRCRRTLSRRPTLLFPGRDRHNATHWSHPTHRHCHRHRH